MSSKEIFIGVAGGILIILIISYLFYENLFFAVILSPYLIFHMKKYKEGLKNKRLDKLSKEFRDTLQSVKGALQSGSSIENAFRDAKREVILMHGRESLMLVELNNITNQLNMNIPLENILEDFAKRSGIEDIKLFAEILKYAKRSGGNIIGIITKTVDTINSKSAVEMEIQTLISGKEYEQKIMGVMPFAIIMYLKICSNSMLEPLYHNLAGIIVMSVCLGIYLFSRSLSEKIIRIEV